MAGGQAGRRAGGRAGGGGRGLRVRLPNNEGEVAGRISGKIANCVSRDTGGGAGRGGVQQASHRGCRPRCENDLVAVRGIRPRLTASAWRSWRGRPLTLLARGCDEVVGQDLCEVGPTVRSGSAAWPFRTPRKSEAGAHRLRRPYRNRQDCGRSSSDNCETQIKLAVYATRAGSCARLCLCYLRRVEQNTGVEHSKMKGRNKDV